MKIDIHDLVVSKVLKTIKEHKLIQNNDGVVVGISGGPDSVCLLHVFNFLAEKFNMKIFAVHVNHMLRGEESKGDEEYVKSLCNALRIPLFVRSLDISKISDERGISLEEAGREVRYELFTQAAREFGADKIAVAHNKNDQAETVLFNMLRGTGLDGLKGMEYIRGNIIRPLLDTKREHIEDYCSKYSLNPKIDRSNLESIYTRNKIRLELIPYINRLMEVDSVESIYKMTRLLKDDYDFIGQTTKGFYDSCVVKRLDEEIRLDILTLEKLHPAVQKRVIRSAVMELKGDLKGIERVHVSSIIDMYLSGKTGAQVHLPFNIRAERSYDLIKIFIYHEDKKRDKFDENVNITGVTKIEQLGASIESFLKKRTEDIEVYSNIRYNSLEQFFDYDKLNMGINIRNRKPGDTFKPLKSNGTKKLKEYFINNKVPRDERDKIPLIAKENEIVWVIGYKISDKFKVTENTKRVLRLKYTK